MSGPHVLERVWSKLTGRSARSRSRKEAIHARRAEKQEQAVINKEKKAERELSKLNRRQTHLPEDLQSSVADLLDRPEGQPLPDYSYRILSQRGEDGITIELMRRLDVSGGRCVELGSGANGGNAGVLIAGLGFKGLLVDGDAELLELAGSLFTEFEPRVAQAWITRESVNDLLAAQGFSAELDYLGLDLDGIDYWILDALDTRPKILICEYNPFFGPVESVSVPYASDFSRSARGPDGNFVYPKSFYGASLQALTSLGHRMGYRLVCTAPNSHNAYFVRADLDAAPEVTPSEAFRLPVKGKDGTPHQRERYGRIQQQGPRAYFEASGRPLDEVP